MRAALRPLPVPCVCATRYCATRYCATRSELIPRPATNLSTEGRRVAWASPPSLPPPFELSCSLNPDVMGCAGYLCSAAARWARTTSPDSADPSAIRRVHCEHASHCAFISVCKLCGTCSTALPETIVAGLGWAGHHSRRAVLCVSAAHYSGCWAVWGAGWPTAPRRQRQQRAPALWLPMALAVRVFRVALCLLHSTRLAARRSASSVEPVLRPSG